jgi:hypothetical protein
LFHERNTRSFKPWRELIRSLDFTPARRRVPLAIRACKGTAVQQRVDGSAVNFLRVPVIGLIMEQSGEKVSPLVMLGGRLIVASTFIGLKGVRRSWDGQLLNKSKTPLAY